MTEFIRTWIMGLVAASFLSAIAMTLCPKGKVRAVVGLCAGLVTIVTLVGPILNFDYQAHFGALDDFESQLEQRLEEMEFEQERLRSIIISERSRTYIWDKAEVLGMGNVEIQVDTVRAETGELIPYRVHIGGVYTQEQREDLERYLAETFGIPRVRQHWSDTNEES